MYKYQLCFVLFFSFGVRMRMNIIQVILQTGVIEAIHGDSIEGTRIAVGANEIRVVQLATLAESHRIDLQLSVALW